jgi:hypothetical protein
VQKFQGEDEQARARLADCLKASQVWISASDGPIKLSEASATLLTNPPDYDRVRFLARASVTDTWKALFERLLVDPTADFTAVEEPEVCIL